MSLAELARQVAADYPQITRPTELVEKLLEQYPDELIDRSRKSMRYACGEAIKFRYLPNVQVAQGLPVEETSFRDEIAGGTRTIESVQSGTIRTLEGLLDACDVDPLDWMVERHTINKWDVTMSSESGPVVATNWQVKATLVPNTRLTELTIAEIAAQLAPLIAKGGYGFRPKKADTKGYLLELDLFDIHLGKFCDPLEGGAAYNLDIAAEVFNSAIDTLVHRASGFPVERVLLPIGNDFFNSDSLANTTTKGTPQHESAKWQRVFSTGCALVTDVINRLRRRGYAVDVVIVSGNHDFQRAYYLGQVLEAAFATCDDVTVDNSHTARKYYVWNDCALMLTHGNEEKEGDLPQIFAAEKPSIWGATTFREVHLGHRHHKKETKYRSTEEYKGVTVRYIRSLSATDEWHRTKGYIGSQRSAEAFVWSHGEGIVAHFTNTIAA